MKVLRLMRRMDTPENRAYWNYIERTALQVRADAHMHMCCGRGRCKFSDGVESCATVQRKARRKLTKRKVAVYV